MARVRYVGNLLQDKVIRIEIRRVTVQRFSGAMYMVEVELFSQFGSSICYAICSSVSIKLVNVEVAVSSCSGNYSGSGNGSGNCRSSGSGNRSGSSCGNRSGSISGNGSGS